MSVLLLSQEQGLRRRFKDGKVCLSLLGTWAGPGWVAGKSTLLQASKRDKGGDVFKPG